MKEHKLMLIIPSLIGLLFVASMMFALTAQERQVTPSVLVGKAMPEFKVRILESKADWLDNTILKTDKSFTLLNVWASWCAVCQSEHDFLMNLASKDNIRIVGLNYRDDRDAANHVLTMLGSPYVATIFDPQGHLALDIGVISTPETYLLDKQGIVLFRYSGALDEAAWQDYFKPLIVDLN
jgi:cytochrome c biogenesis protein CcmG/thiol:disulfide interchange protein DsbE